MNKNFIVDSYKAEFRMDKYRDDLIEKYNNEVKIDGLKNITDDYVNALIENENAYGVVNVSIDKFKYDLMNKFECYLIENEREKPDKVVYEIRMDIDDYVDRYVDYLIDNYVYEYVDDLDDLMEVKKKIRDEVVSNLNSYMEAMDKVMDKVRDKAISDLNSYVNSLMEDKGGNENGKDR